jgi:hypothetical protein
MFAVMSSDVCYRYFVKMGQYRDGARSRFAKRSPINAMRLLPVDGPANRLSPSPRSMPTPEESTVMQYRSWVLTAATLLVLGSTAARAEDKKASAPFVHTVIFYLKADAPSSTADDIVTDCHEMLAKVPTVRSLKAGKPAEGGAGKKDFAVGLVILFDNAADFKTYVDHPNHKKFVGKYLKHLDTSKLAAFDFVDGK